MKVHWTDRAKQRLKLIHDHIAKDAPLVAPSVIERLVRRSMQIGEFPHSGREVSEYQARLLNTSPESWLNMQQACCFPNRLIQTPGTTHI